MTPEDAQSLFDIYLSVLSLLAILVVPASLYCTIRAWGFVRKYRGYKLPVIFAIVNTIAFPIAGVIGYLAWNRLTGGAPADWSPPITALGFVVLDCIPLITTGYMIWLDSSRMRTERRTPPSE